MKKALLVVATVSAAPALTFDRPASTKVNYGWTWDWDRSGRGSGSGRRRFNR